MGAEDRGWGWPASQRRNIVDLEVAGTDFPGGVNEIAAPVMASLAADLHQHVERLHDGWCWGYAYRRIRGSSAWSNHAWGLAVDFNAPEHPIGVHNTFSEVDQRRCREIARRHGCRWGGDYSGRPDDMHFEFMGTPAQARRLARHLPDYTPGGGKGSDGIDWGPWRNVDPGERTLDLGDRGRNDVAVLQRFVGADGDGWYGPGTEDHVRRYQQMRNLAVDGICGPKTWAEITPALDGDGRRRPDRDDGSRPAPDFPLPRRHWYGPESDNRRNHSGHWRRDRDDIRRLQARLRHRGWDIGVDGRYGPQTAGVVEAFQREKRIHPYDGLTGIKTWPRFWTEPIT